jgi:hypothetical protein
MAEYAITPGPRIFHGRRKSLLLYNGITAKADVEGVNDNTAYLIMVSFDLFRLYLKILVEPDYAIVVPRQQNIGEKKRANQEYNKVNNVFSKHKR